VNRISGEKMHWHTHALHDEYSVDHFDHYKIKWVPPEQGPPESEGIGTGLATMIALLLAAIVALIMVLLA